MMKSMKRIVIVGAGPAGCMAAITAKQHHPDAQVILIDGNDRIGVKLSLTGGGRCNVTANVSSDQIIKNTPRNGRFLYSALNQFNAQSIIEFFTSRQLSLVEEDHHRMFPKSNKAQDVIQVLLDELNQLQVQILLKTRITGIDSMTKQLFSDQTHLHFDQLVLAMGGVSYPETGSTRQGFDLIQSLGHTIIDFKPAEVPLVSHSTLIQSKELQGLSFKDVLLNAYVNDKKIVSLQHDLLFTHFGLSGPAALQTSSYLTHHVSSNNKLHVIIDFLPHIKQQDIPHSPNKEELSKLLIQIPKRLINVLLRDIPYSEIPLKLKAFHLDIHGTRGFSTAFVSSGGVDVNEIIPQTMQSKLHPWLSICGESLDVNSLTGGYNMTIAFATGYVAGKNVATDT
jgi:predicted Rossmann fold flavoprotein